jgi:TonB family protein
MYFDFEDRYTDYQPVGGAIRRWDGVLISVVVHAVIVLVVLLAPALPMFQRSPAEQAQVVRPDPERERPQFVFVQPRLDMEAKQPRERAEASDKNRIARAERPAPAPSNPLPNARGNSSQRVESSPAERAKGEGPAPDPARAPPVPDIVERVPTPPAQRAEAPQPQTRPRPPQGGSLGEALRNLQKYVDQESFSNDKGQVQNLGPLQFDTKGVEFGPWIRRFVAQVRRNWFVPMAAMSLRGHVVLTFYVHRNGALTDVQIVQPSAIESFNVAAKNALLASNPTQPLPPEYPDDKAFFTVTFYYNESPGQ